MRAAAAAGIAALVLLAGCTGGDGPPGPPSTPATVASTVPATTVTSGLPTTVPGPDPTGSVTLRVSGFSLPELRSGGSGLRVLVRAASGRLTVRRRGGGGGVAACPVAGVAAAVAAGECRDVTAAGAVELPFVGGVELRATGAAAVVEEVTVTWLPADRTTTLVTPARPAGACAARACEATFTLTPGGAGPFRLDGRPEGGRPRLVLTSVRTAPGGSNRTLATVEGGGFLSIRATVEAGAEAVLLHQEQGPDPVFAVTAEISWP